MAGRLRGKWREDFAVGNGGKISGGKWREDLWCDMAGRLGGIVSTYLSLIYIILAFYPGDLSTELIENMRPRRGLATVICQRLQWPWPGRSLR